MENRKDYEKRLGERLEAAYMQEDIGPVMSREEFHRLIQTAEKKKKHRRTMLSLAAACVALCLVCGGFVAGMTMRESASAGKDDETKTVQQGGSVVIGSGVSENDQNVGVSTKTYTNIEDIPEDIRKEIHFLNSDEFELEKVVITDSAKLFQSKSFYSASLGEIIIKENYKKVEGVSAMLYDCEMEYKGRKLYRKIYNENEELVYFFFEGEEVITISFPANIKMEAVLDDLLNLE